MGNANPVMEAMKEDANWVPDEAREGCFNCERTFGLAIRRHHCRCCGEIFCSKCWGNKVQLPPDMFPSAQEKLTHIKRKKDGKQEAEVLEKTIVNAQHQVCRVCQHILVGDCQLLSPPPIEMKLVKVGVKPPESSLEESRTIDATKKIANAAMAVVAEAQEKESQGKRVSHSLEDRSTVRWSRNLEEDYEMSIGAWRPFTKGTHFRFQVKGYSGGIDLTGQNRWSASSRVPSQSAQSAGSGHDAVSTRTLQAFSSSKLPKSQSAESFQGYGAFGGSESPSASVNTTPRAAALQQQNYTGTTGLPPRSPRKENNNSYDSNSESGTAGSFPLLQGSIVSGGSYDAAISPTANNPIGDSSNKTTAVINRSRRAPPAVTITPPPQASAGSESALKSSSSRTELSNITGQNNRDEEESSSYQPVVLVGRGYQNGTPVPEENRPPSALKRSRKRSDARDLRLDRTNDSGSANSRIENGASISNRRIAPSTAQTGGDDNNSGEGSSAAGWRPTLPPSWRIGCRSVLSCEVTKEFEQGRPMLKIETASQFLVFNFSNPGQAKKVVEAINAARDISRVRSHVHVAVKTS